MARFTSLPDLLIQYLQQNYDRCRMLLHCRALLSFPGGWNRLKYMQHHILPRLQESVVSPVWCSFHLQLRWSYLYYTNICSKMQEKIEQMFAKPYNLITKWHV